MTAHVIGLDLSLRATGVADQQGQETYTPPAADLTDQLMQLHHLFTTAMAPHLVGRHLDLVVVEDYLMNPRFGSYNGLVHGAFRLAWAMCDPRPPLLWVSPAALKVFATGKGNASKPDIRMAVFQRYGIDLADNNQADAFVLRAIGMHVLGEPLAVLPQTHTRALAKLQLPDGLVAA